MELLGDWKCMNSVGIVGGDWKCSISVGILGGLEL